MTLFLFTFLFCFLHQSVYDQVLAGLKKAYGSILTRIGDPLDDGTLYGPMHSKVGVEGYKKSIEEAVATGGKIEFGGKVIDQYNFLVYLLFLLICAIFGYETIFFRENDLLFFFYHDVQ